MKRSQYWKASFVEELEDKTAASTSKWEETERSFLKNMMGLYYLTQSRSSESMKRLTIDYSPCFETSRQLWNFMRHSTRVSNTQIPLY